MRRQGRPRRGRGWCRGQAAPRGAPGEQGPGHLVGVGAGEGGLGENSTRCVASGGQNERAAVGVGFAIGARQLLGGVSDGLCRRLLIYMR